MGLGIVARNAGPALMCRLAGLLGSLSQGQLHDALTGTAWVAPKALHRHGFTLQLLSL